MKKRFVVAGVYKGRGGVEEGSYDDALRTRVNHMTFPSRRHAAPSTSFSNRPRHSTMSSSLETDYATIKVSLSLHGSSPVSDRRMQPEYSATSQEFASVPTDHTGLTLTLPRLHPPHAHFRSRFLLFNVSPSHQPLLYVHMSHDLSFSFQPAKRDGQGIDGSDRRKRTRRFRNGSHVLYCRGIRIKNACPICFRTLEHIWAP